MERNRKPELTIFFAVGCYAGHRFAKRIREKADENKAKRANKASKASKTDWAIRQAQRSASRIFRRSPQSK